MCFERHISEAEFPGQRIWTIVGNRLVEAYIQIMHMLQKQELCEQLFLLLYYRSCLIKGSFARFPVERNRKFETERETPLVSYRNSRKCTVVRCEM
jgi:hypothetical protein